MTPTITLIDTTRLKPNPNNPRKNIGDITALADSIRAHGIQQELVVTPIADSTDYRVVIGHRRLAASQQAGLAQVPCRIMELSPKDERELMVIENTQRHDLTPIEEADAYQGLLDLGSSIENMAEKTGRSTDFVRRRLKIAGIPRLTRALAKDFNQLSLSDLDVLAEFQGDETTQQELARQAGTNNWDWTVRKAREERKGTVWMNKALDYLTAPDSKPAKHPRTGGMTRRKATNTQPASPTSKTPASKNNGRSSSATSRTSTPSSALTKPPTGPSSTNASPKTRSTTPTGRNKPKNNAEPTRANRRRRHGNCTMPAKPCEPNGSIKPRTHGRNP